MSDNTTGRTQLMERAVIDLLHEAGRDFQLGYYAEAASQLRGAAVILDSLAKPMEDQHG